MDDRAEAIDILTRMSTNHFYGHREQEAFKLGAEALKQRWIPVTERLPEEEGQYLVCCNNKHHQFEVARFYINYDGDRWFCCDWNDPENIVAWMPLPEPYKGGEEE